MHSVVSNNTTREANRERSMWPRPLIGTISAILPGGWFIWGCPSGLAGFVLLLGWLG
ncbi:hypothetical protein BDW75DRAFT_203740 [Aspergillus navahoensis]